MTTHRAIRDGLPASHFQLPPGPWATVLQALCAHFPAIAEDTWSDRFTRGRVLDASGQPLDVAAPYRLGATIQYFREVVDEPVIPFSETIVHHDAHLVVACKPHYLPVVPAGVYVRQTLLARLTQTLDNLHLVPLHRIDRDTAGLVLFSANPESRGAYQALFRERRIDKHYLAVAPPLPRLSFPYVHRSRMVVGEPFFRMCEVPGEVNSETLIDVLHRGPDNWTYRLQPVSGRKHQLRVHMAALGAPLRHDRSYPQLLPPQAGAVEQPLQLLAQSLSFIDPLDGSPRHFLSPRRLHDDSRYAPPRINYPIGNQNLLGK